MLLVFGMQLAVPAILMIECYRYGLLGSHSKGALPAEQGSFDMCAHLSCDDVASSVC